MRTRSGVTRREWTIIVPGTLGIALGALLGTLGWFGVSFGLGSDCTDFNEAPNACNGFYRWIGVGFVGQWVLVLVSVFLLVTGRSQPQSRRLMSVAAWVTPAFAVAWYAFYYHGAYHSFKVHA